MLNIHACEIQSVLHGAWLACCMILGSCLCGLFPSGRRLCVLREYMMVAEAAGGEAGVIILFGWRAGICVKVLVQMHDVTCNMDGVVWYRL